MAPARASAEDLQPAKLIVDAPEGATVLVDGKQVGTAPLPKPIVIAPGRHTVTVHKSGSVSRHQAVELEEGKATKLRIVLGATGQRTLSWVLIGTGGAAIAGGIVFGVLSVVELRKVRSFNQRADDRPLSEKELSESESAMSARDNYRIGSGIAGGVGLGLFLLGGALMFFDGPIASVPERRAPPESEPAERTPPRSRSSVKTTEQPASDVRISALPIMGPGFAGGAVTLRF
jgi:hypothetical protein